MVVTTANVTLGQRNKRGGQSEELPSRSAMHIAAYEHALELNTYSMQFNVNIVIYEALRQHNQA